MTDAALPLDASSRRKASHYEILGETYAKFEFFEQGWNPYSRFLDVDKVDVILRRNEAGKRIYREVQVKYGKLHRVGQAWEKQLFDLTSWRFFKESEFEGYLDQKNFFVAYVLAADIGYRGDIFIFPVQDFVRAIRCAIPSKGERKVFLSRPLDQPERWVLRRQSRFGAIDEKTCLDVSRYRRNFDALWSTGA